MYCDRCGFELSENDQYCPICEAKNPYYKGITENNKSYEEIREEIKDGEVHSGNSASEKMRASSEVNKNTFAEDTGRQSDFEAASNNNSQLTASDDTKDKSDFGNYQKSFDDIGKRRASGDVAPNLDIKKVLLVLACIYLSVSIINMCRASFSSGNIEQNAKDIPSTVIQETTKIETHQSIDSTHPNKNNETETETKSKGRPDEYIFPESDERVLNDNEINALSMIDLRLAINEIYARHGRKFKEKELSSYFESKSWYYGYLDRESFDESVFNVYEKENINRLAARRNKLSDPMKQMSGSVFSFGTECAERFLVVNYKNSNLYLNYIIDGYDEDGNDISIDIDLKLERVNEKDTTISFHYREIESFDQPAEIDYYPSEDKIVFQKLPDTWEYPFYRVDPDSDMVRYRTDFSGLYYDDYNNEVYVGVYQNVISKQIKDGYIYIKDSFAGLSGTYEIIYSGEGQDIRNHSESTIFYVKEDPSVRMYIGSWYSHGAQAGGYWLNLYRNDIFIDQCICTNYY